MVYTSDLDTIYADLHAGKIDPSMVRIVSSPRPQSMNVLEDFPNITEIFCPIVCPLDKFHNLGALILARHKLIRATFMVFIPETEEEDVIEPASKRQRIIKISPYTRTITVTIPNIIRQIGARIRYMKLDFQILDTDTTIFTFIMLHQGIICGNSNRGMKNILVSLNPTPSMSEMDSMISGENSQTENIFQALVETQNLQGIITFGDALYNLSAVEIIPDLTILCRHFNDSYPLDIPYLKELVSKAETVNLIHSAETFQHYSMYSYLVRSGSVGLLKRIKGVVPVYDVEDHLVINPNLEEIHVYVQNMDDIELLKSILQLYDYRPVSYYVHYSQISDDPYWLALKGFGDIIFENIITTLMPI